MKQKELAKLLHWSESKISGIFNRNLQCSVEDSVLLEEHTGIDALVFYQGSAKKIRQEWNRMIRRKNLARLAELKKKRLNKAA